LHWDYWADVLNHVPGASRARRRSWVAESRTVREVRKAEGEYVAVRYTERGVLARPSLGHEPTGRSYESIAFERFVVRDDRVWRQGRLGFGVACPADPAAAGLGWAAVVF
jgi:hypothetical protein